jgi:hypothetical protein
MYGNPLMPEEQEQVLPNGGGMVAQMAAAKSGNPLAFLAMSEQGGFNPLALMAMAQGPGGYFQDQYGPMAGQTMGADPRIAGAFQREYGPRANPSAGPSAGPRAPAGNYTSQMTGDPAKWAAGIKNIESGSPQGNYSAVGPVTRNGNRAYGAYQVMDFNIPEWTRTVTGRAYTPQEFLADPAVQDAVFEHYFGQAVNRYGNPADAASVWFSGQPLSGNNASDGYTTVPDYVRKFMAAL